VATVRMTVAYDGSGFSGFAPNPGVRTVGATLAAALERLLGHPVALSCAGRTDAGVHAWGQVVSFPTDAQGAGMDLPALRRSLNGLCGPAVVVREVAIAPDGFDARRSATARRYRYTVLNRPVPDPFLAGTTWHVETPLDQASLRLACDPLIGEHDFSSFCRRPKSPRGREASLVRRVLDARWVDLGDGLLRFDIAATAFCHQMVRALVGTLVDVGRGRRRAGDVRAILEARDRARASDLAPPHGLCLWEVRYGDAGDA
jgi:tRNA pseudouridine38-40 synthase